MFVTDSSDIQDENHSVDNSISYINLSLDPDIHVHVPQLLTWKAKFGLTEADKQILHDGKWLNSSIIAAGCKLLKMFFPEQNGLEDTCTLTYKQCNPESFVQILYVNGNHWLCVSNKLTYNQSVEMFDSLHTVPVEDGEIAFQVAGILAPVGPSFEIDLVNVHLQHGATDCGLYALAYAFDLCAGKDPFEATYDQDLMRSHLLSCFEEEQFKSFPMLAEKCHVPKRRVVHSYTIEVHCNCRRPEKVPMAECDVCGLWFHDTCEAIPPEVFSKDDVPWSCSMCKSPLIAWHKCLCCV